MTDRFDFGFFAPAGAIVDGAAVDRAAQRLLSLGHRVVEDEGSRLREQRFAGNDDARLAAIGRMAARDDVDVAVAIRGGYGLTRLLPRLDFAALRRSPRRWMGHSDFTVFQLAALAGAGMVTYAGPMAAYDFGAEHPSPFTMDHCERLLDTGADAHECPLDGPDFVGEGTLWGGNLALVAHLVGTPHLPNTKGGLLFLEDIGEHPYRVERMLYQLHFAGVLARQRAVLLGTFNGYEAAANDNGYGLDAMIAHARASFGVPIFAGLPFGHCPDKLTLPVGGHCVLRVHGGMARIELRVPARPADRHP